MFDERVKNILRAWKNLPATTVAARFLSRWMTTSKNAPSAAQGIGRELRLACIEQTVSIAAAASGDLTTQLPVGAKVLFSQMNFDTVVTPVTAVKVGFGTAADPDRFGLSDTTLTKNTKTFTAPLEAVSINNTAVTMRVTAVDTNGAAAGTMTGTVRVLIAYWEIEPLPDAP